MSVSVIVRSNERSQVATNGRRAVAAAVHSDSSSRRGIAVSVYAHPNLLSANVSVYSCPIINYHFPSLLHRHSPMRLESHCTDRKEEKGVNQYASVICTPAVPHSYTRSLTSYTSVSTAGILKQ